MIFFYIIAIVLLIVGVRFNKNGFYDDYLGKEQTNVIKGFFILTVLFSHMITQLGTCGYDFGNNVFDISGKWVRDQLSQLIVTLFLFYSGYGVMESIKSKGNAYLSHFPRRRLLNTLLNFDVAMVVYALLSLILGVEIIFKKVLLALVAWENLGNSNWYIFAIMCCYMVTYACFKLFNKHKSMAVFSVVLLVLMLELVLYKYKNVHHWWYDTIMCYPAGVLYSLYKDVIVKVCKRCYWAVLSGLVVAFVVLHLQQVIPNAHGLAYNLQSVVFALLVVHLTMKIKTDNKVVAWLGMNLFPIYVYHRVPMIALKTLAGDAFLCKYAYFYIVICCVVALCIAAFYKYWQIRLQ